MTFFFSTLGDVELKNKILLDIVEGNTLYGNMSITNIYKLTGKEWIQKL